MTDDLDHSMEVDVLAAMLRDDQRASGDWLEHLATKLEGALPDWTRVERKGGLFARHKKVHSITVEMTDTHYAIERGRHGPVARMGRIVRGVALSHRQLPVEQWIEELAHAIKAFAETSAEINARLEKFVLGE